MTDLTSQWKKGELPDGYYYCKLILNNMKPSVERCKAHCIPMGVSADKGEEVIAPVPSYEEWQASEKYNKHLEEVIKVYERKDKQATETSIAYNELLEELERTKADLKNVIVVLLIVSPEHRGWVKKNWNDILEELEK